MRIEANDVIAIDVKVINCITLAYRSTSSISSTTAIISTESSAAVSIFVMFVSLFIIDIGWHKLYTNSTQKYTRLKIHVNLLVMVFDSTVSTSDTVNLFNSWNVYLLQRVLRWRWQAVCNYCLVYINRISTSIANTLKI